MYCAYLSLLCMCVCVLSHVWFFATLWTVDPQAPLFMEFSRKEYWSWLPFPSPADPPKPGTESTVSESPALASRFFTSWATREALGSPQSVSQFSYSVMSEPLQPHESQHTRPPCPSPTTRVHPNSCSLSRWCHPTISSSVIPFSCPQSFPASGFSQTSQLFASGG